MLAEVDRGLDAVIVNPAFMLGPWDWKPSSGRMLLAVAEGWGLFPPYGWSSMVDARDVAAGILAAVERGRRGRRYILAGETMSYGDAWKLFAEVTGGAPPLLRPPRPILYVAGLTGDLLGLVTGREPEVNSAAIAMAALAKHYSSRRAEEELGYRTRPFRETVADAWDWFCGHGYAKPRTPPRAKPPRAREGS